MHRLIYLTSFGAKTHHLLRICVESVRVAGKFTGDILIFSDLPVDVPTAKVRIVQTTTDWERIMFARIEHGLTIDFNSYDQIAYLDIDVLAIAPLDRFFTEMDSLRAMEMEGTHVSDGNAGGALTPAEREHAERAAVCAGVFAGNSAVVKAALEHWRDIYAQTPSNHYRDQWAFNALIHRKLVPFRPYAYDTVAPMKGAHSPSTCLVHYWARQKRHMPEAWAAWKAKKPPDYCAPRITVTGTFPLVTIITATHNRPTELLRAVQSVADQTYPYIEHIVVADGPQELPPLPPSVHVITLGRNWQTFTTPGYGAIPRQAGCFMARGDLIGYLDDDNTYRPEHVELLVKKILGGGNSWGYSKMQRLRDGRPFDVVGEPAPRIGQVDLNMFMHRASVLQRVSWKPVGYSSDWEFIKSLALRDSAFVDTITVDYNMGPLAK